MRQISSTVIISYVDDDLGLCVDGAVGSIGSGLPTTASTYAVGCAITDKSTGIIWINTGTVASPVWNHFLHHSLAAAGTSAGCG